MSKEKKTSVSVTVSFEDDYADVSNAFMIALKKLGLKVKETWDEEDPESPVTYIISLPEKK